MNKKRRMSKTTKVIYIISILLFMVGVYFKWVRIQPIAGTVLHHYTDHASGELYLILEEHKAVRVTVPIFISIYDGDKCRFYQGVFDMEDILYNRRGRVECQEPQ